MYWLRGPVYLLKFLMQFSAWDQTFNKGWSKQILLNLFVKSLNTCWEKAMDAKSLPFLQSERHALEPLWVPRWNT